MRRAPTDGGLGLRLLVERASGEFPDRCIVSRGPDGCTTYGYGEFGRRVRALASGLCDLGIGPGDRVASLAWNTERHLEAMFAVSCIGAVLETLNVHLTPAELERLLERSRPRALFVDETLIERAPRVAPAVTHILLSGATGGEPGLAYEDLLAGGDEGFELPAIDELLPATACYTSATTGPPKRVEYSHRSLVVGSLVLNQPGVTPLREGDRVLPIVPLFHANAWGLPFAAMLSGADLILPGPHPTSADLGELIGRQRVTQAAAVPTVFEALLDVPGADLSSLREVYCAGSPPGRRLVRAFRERHGVELVHAWGMTETCFFGLVSRPGGLEGLSAEEQEELGLAQGRPVPLFERRLSTAGELEVRGPAVAGAYVEARHARAYTEDGWLRTGDLAVHAGRGFVKLVDRLHDTIKSGGEWIHSLVLETLLHGVDGIDQVAVVAAPNDRYGERPYAFVVTSAERSLDPEILYAQLAAHVPRWWVPDAVEIVDQLPLTSTGKIDKRALRSSLGEDRERVCIRLGAPSRAAIAR